MTTSSIQDIEKRTQRYWFDDGLWDLGFGIVCLLIGIVSFILFFTQLEGVLGMVFVLAQTLIIIGSFSAIGKVISYFKERITYPRAGYVVYRKPAARDKVKRILRSFFIAAFIGGLVSMLASLSVTRNYLAVITAGLMGMMAFYLGIRFGVLRYILISVITVALGFFISVFHLENDASIAGIFCGMGILWLLSGGITLWHFLTSTQIAQPEDLNPEGL